MARLVVFRGRSKEGSHELTERSYVLGRSEVAGIRIDNPLVSREHCKVCYERGAWRVQDLGAPNGLFVNGERVEDHRLRAGDRLELGKHVVIFEGAGETAFDVDTVAPGQRFSADFEDEPTTILPPGEMQSIHRKVRNRLACHLVVTGGGQRREIRLVRPTHMLGFGADCDLRLPGSSLLVKKLAELSRRVDGSYAVVALSALAPVKVNGKRVSSQPLEDGDSIEVKGFSFRFHSAIL